MPFKSQAQRRKFAEMMVKGEISQETFEEWNRETGSAKLPERVQRKSSGKRAGSARKSAEANGRESTAKKKSVGSAGSRRKSATRGRTAPKSSQKSAVRRKK